MKTVAEAWALVEEMVVPLAPEQVELGSARGRALREDVRADADHPPFTRSAMDGFLLREGESERFLRVPGEVRPGEPARMPEPGCAIRVFTGSAVPDEGAVVVMQEDADPEAGGIRICAKPCREHIRPRGSHARRGDILVSAGTRLTPGGIAVLASAGVARIRVSPVVGAAHIVTGRELVGPEAVPGDGEIRDSNSPMIAALLDEAGARRAWHRRMDEDRAALVSAIAEASASGPHLLLISGGASVGDHDHTAAALRDAGFEVLVEGVAIRPGKPLIIACRGGLIAFGLPGNPLSHFVSFHLFVRRAIDRLCGVAPARLVRLRVRDASLLRPHPRETWWPCRVSRDAGGLAAVPSPWRDSSDIVALAGVGGLLRVPPEGVGPTGEAEVLLTEGWDI